MFSDIVTVQNEIWESLRERAYRDAFADSHIGTNIVAQLKEMREARGLTQAQLAELTGMAQARISLMENPSYDQFTLSTLKRLRAPFDVALIVRFVPYSELVNWTTTVTPENLAPKRFDEDQL